MEKLYLGSIDRLMDGRMTDEERRNLISTLSAELEIEENVALAFFKVEGGGIAFCQNGNPLIRFEPHVFASPKRMAQFGVKPSEVPWAADTDEERKQRWLALGFQHGSNCSTNHYEWDNLQTAISIHEELAYQSTSIGLAQIMGFNHKSFGYSSAKKMFSTFCDNEEAQIKGFFDFVKTRENGALLTALKEKDWKTAARYYNGVGQIDVYSEKLEKHYNQLSSTNKEGEC
jgi:hypothetical protein